MKDLLCVLEFKKTVRVSYIQGDTCIINMNDLGKIFNPKEIRSSTNKYTQYFSFAEYRANDDSCYFDQRNKLYLIKSTTPITLVEDLYLTVATCLTSSQDRRLPVDPLINDSYLAIYRQGMSSSMEFNQSFENIIYGVLSTSMSDLSIPNNELTFSEILSDEIETEGGKVYFYRIDNETGEIKSLSKGYMTKVSMKGNNINVSIENFLTNLDKPLYANKTYDLSMPEKFYGPAYYNEIVATPRLFGGNAPFKLNYKPEAKTGTMPYGWQRFDLDFDSMYQGFRMLPEAILPPLGEKISTFYLKDHEDVIDDLVKGLSVHSISIAPLAISTYEVLLANKEDIKWLLTGDCIFLKDNNETTPSLIPFVVNHYIYNETEDLYGVLVNPLPPYSPMGLVDTDAEFVVISALNGFFVEDSENNMWIPLNPDQLFQNFSISNNCLILNLNLGMIIGSTSINALINAGAKTVYRYKNLRDPSLNNHAMVALEILRTEFNDDEINVQSFIDSANAHDQTVVIMNVDDGNSFVSKREALKRCLTTAMGFIYVNDEHKISYGLIDPTKEIYHVFDGNSNEMNTLSFSWENKDSYNSCVLINEETELELSARDVDNYNMLDQDKQIKVDYHSDVREFALEIIETDGDFAGTKFFENAKRTMGIYMGRKAKVSFSNLSKSKDVKLGQVVKVVDRKLPSDFIGVVTGISSSIKRDNITVVKIKEISNNIEYVFNGEKV